MTNSSRIIENILNSTITGIIQFFLPAIVTFIYSTIIGWTYKISIVSVMCNIPPYVFIILFLPFCYWAIRKYIKRKMNEGIRLTGYSTYKNYEPVDMIEYNQLLWEILVKSRTLRNTQLYGDLDDIATFQELTNKLRVSSIPRCSRCGAELYFTRHDLWYTYDCVNPECGFVKRTWKSRDKMRDIAKKQYKFNLETEFYERNK